MRRPAPLLLAVLLPLVPLAGCESLQSTDGLLGVITPYRIDIVQGNVVTKEQLALLKPGMSRAQVRDILGTPLLTDPFHADRWDYIFTIRRRGTDEQRRSVVIRFEGEAIKTIDAPELPSEREFIAGIAPRRDVKVPALELTEAQRAALPPPRRTTPGTAAPEPAGPARSYPPLEAGS